MEKNFFEEVINLTPHDVVISLPDRREITYPASGQVARVDTIPGQEGEIFVGGETIPFVTPPEYGEVTGLPEPEEGTIFIVSGFVLQKVVGRVDVFAPGTGPQDGVIRYTEGSLKGKIRAVTRLIRAS